MDAADPPVHEMVERALREDLGDLGDVTARVSVDKKRPGTARIFAKARGVVAGTEPARLTFAQVDPAADLWTVGDGHFVHPGEVVLKVQSTAAAILAAERTALNFLQRLSGVATRTAAFVDAVRGTGAEIYDTRKTTPGLRLLEKAAVRAGGGHNHRMGMFDQVLLKENNFALARPRSIEEVVRDAVAESLRLLGPDVAVIAEARDPDEARAAVTGGAGIILLDNFAPGVALRELVQSLRRLAAERGRPLRLEASGGISLDNVRAFAECGVDRISVGAITHSAPALDMSLLVEGLQ
ncbi:MAG: carboxylating nicotinate-nucleotide diphosphorylase [Planctomycetota bacterium]